MAPVNIRQFRTACEIARCRFNMSAAAVALHRSQPALSRQVAELENELGLRIFARTSNRIVGPTPRGEQVLAGGERIVRELDALRGLSTRSPETTSERRIATTHTHARYTLPVVVERFALGCRACC